MVSEENSNSVTQDETLATQTQSLNILRLHIDDNIVVARQSLKAGTEVVLEGVTYSLMSDVPVGFKIARVPIQAGDKILKYGAPIGSAKVDIVPGELVHLHNIKSDYLPTYTPDSVAFTQGRKRP